MTAWNFWTCCRLCPLCHGRCPLFSLLICLAVPSITPHTFARGPLRCTAADASSRQEITTVLVVCAHSNPQGACSTYHIDKRAWSWWCWCQLHHDQSSLLPRKCELRSSSAGGEYTSPLNDSKWSCLGLWIVVVFVAHHTGREHQPSWIETFPRNWGRGSHWCRTATPSDLQQPRPNHSPARSISAAATPPNPHLQTHKPPGSLGLWSHSPPFSISFVSVTIPFPSNNKGKFSCGQRRMNRTRARPACSPWQNRSAKNDTC